MKNIITLIAISISVSISAQVEFFSEYDHKIDSLSMSVSGVKCSYENGFVYAFDNWSFDDLDFNSVISECTDFLEEYDLELDSPGYDDSSMDLDVYNLYSTYVYVMAGEVIQKAWKIEIDDDSYYMAVLILRHDRIDFGMELVGMDNKIN